MFIYENEGTFTLIIIFSPITCQHVLLKKMERKNTTFINNMFSKTLLHPWIIHRWFRKSHFLKIQTLRKKRVRAIIWSFIFTQSNSSFVCLFCFLFAWKWLNPECQRCCMSAQNYISQGRPFKKFFLKSLCLFQHSKATLIKAWLTYFSSVVFPQGVWQQIQI